MTIASEVSRSGPYPGNGVATVFDYDFRIVDAAHLQVIKAVTATSEETTLVLNTDYTVSGVGNDDGSITVTLAPATGETITILRNVPFTQGTDLENQGPYLAETVEAALDLAAMRDQQLAEELQRAIKLPASSDDNGGELAAQLAADITRLAQSADEIDTVAAIDGDVTTVANISSDVALLADHAGILSGTASAIYAAEDLFVGDGVDTTWTLSTSPASEANVDVWIGGAIQTNADFSIAGNALTITPAVANGVQIIAKTRVYVSANDVYEARDQAIAAAEEAEQSAATVNPATIVHVTVDSFTVAQKRQARQNIGLSGNEVTRSAQTRATAASMDMTGESGVIVLAYSSTSQIMPALYTRVGSEPTHSLKFQDATGAWFEISEDVIHVEMAGAKWGDGATDAAPFFQAAIDAAAIRASVYSSYAHVAANGPAYRIATPVYIAGPNASDQIDVDFSGRMLLYGSGTFVLGRSDHHLGSARIRFGTLTGLGTSNPAIIVRAMYGSSLEWMDIGGIGTGLSAGIVIQPDGVACCDNVYRGNRVINVNGSGIAMDNSLGVIASGKNWHMQNSYFEVNFVQSCQIGFLKQCVLVNAPMDLTTFIGAFDFNTIHDIEDQQPNSNSHYFLRYHDAAGAFVGGGALVGTGMDTSTIHKMNRGSSGADGVFVGVGNERAGFVGYGELMFMTSTARDPTYNGQVVFQRNSNTSGVFKMKGLDGVIRDATLTFS